jgi:hypothetical protein
MSQSIHFSRIKYFSEEFTEKLNYEQVLKELKKKLQQAEEELKKREATIDQEVIEITEDIDFDWVISAGTDEIKKLLIKDPKKKLDPETLLHPELRYYFVDENLWKVLQQEIFRESKNIKDESKFFKFANDCVEIENNYKKKMLVFEAS